jgi:hypothetical protein
MPENDPHLVEYGCRWTDWEDWTAEGERKTRVRYDRGGYLVRPQCSGLQAGGEADRPA